MHDALYCISVSLVSCSKGYTNYRFKYNAWWCQFAMVCILNITHWKLYDIAEHLCMRGVSWVIRHLHMTKLRTNISTKKKGGEEGHEEWMKSGITRVTVEERGNGCTIPIFHFSYPPTRLLLYIYKDIRSSVSANSSGVLMVASVYIS